MPRANTRAAADDDSDGGEGHAPESEQTVGEMRAEMLAARDAAGDRFDRLESLLVKAMGTAGARAAADGDGAGDGSADGRHGVDGRAAGGAGNDAGRDAAAVAAGPRGAPALDDGASADARGDGGRGARSAGGGGADGGAQLAAAGSGPFADDPDSDGGRAGAGGVHAVKHSRDYRWPAERSLYNDFKVNVLDDDEMSECVRGFSKLREGERTELLYWYPIAAKLNSIKQNLERGLLRGNEQCIADDIADCVGQCEPRITQLVQTAKAVSGRSQYSRAYWRDQALAELDDRRSSHMSGSMGARHEKTKAAILYATAKATANAEVKRKFRRGYDKEPKEVP